MEETVDITEDQGDPVGEIEASASDHQHTALPSSVSTSSPAQSTQSRTPDLAEVRKLQSTNDRLRAQLDQEKKRADEAVLARAQLQQRYDQLERDRGAEVSKAAEATQAALDARDKSDTEVASLRARVTRAEFLLSRQDLLVWAELAPQTADTKVLEAWAEKLTVIRDRERASVQSQINGRTVPPANPRRVTIGTTSAKDLDKYLDTNDPDFRKKFKALTGADL